MSISCRIDADVEPRLDKRDGRAISFLIVQSFSRSGANMPGTKPPTAATLRAYKLSRYNAGSIVAYVGKRPKGLSPGQGAREIVLLGACNPYGRRLPDGWNARMMSRLRIVLRRSSFIEANGALGRWSESMLAASMDPRRAAVVARRFRQNAIVIIRENRRATLKII